MVSYSLDLDIGTIKKIAERRSILLDTSVWIRLADGKNTRGNKT